MKFAFALFSLLSTASAMMHELKDIPADSALGMKVLSKARNLEDYADFQNTWVAGYSIKFQGCHHVSQWNAEAEGEDDVRIVTKRLVRFRLCPTQYCSSGNTQGCSNGYGDYIIDMNSYLEAYAELKSNNNYQYAQEENMYEEAQEEQQYQAAQYDYQQAYSADISDYIECQQANFGRRVEEMQNGEYNQYGQYDQGNQWNQWDGSYYIGPYCASQGGAIYLGVFTDDTCSTFADNNGGRDTYLSNTGGSLPFGKDNMVDMDCLSCSESGAYYYNYGDEQDQDDVLEACETVYEVAGKCEDNLPYGTSISGNSAACNYMEGIKIVRKDGTIQTAATKANKTASVFMGLLVTGFVMLSGYVYFLKQKLDRTSINLSED